MFNPSPSEKLRMPLTPILLASIFISPILFPPIPLGGSFSIRVDDLLALGLIPLTLYFRPRIIPFTPLVIFLTFIAFTTFSLLQGYAFLDVPPSTRDIFEIIRLAKPLLILILVPYVSLERYSDLTIRVLKWGAWFMIGIGFLQYFNVGGLGGILGGLYSTERHTEALLASSSRRVFLTGSDPNTGAILCLFFVSYYLASILHRFQTIKAVKLFLLLVVLLMTSSRTGFLGLAVIVFWFLAFQQKSLLVRLGVVGLFLAVVGILLPYFQYLILGLTMALEGNNASLNKRLETWADALFLFQQAPFFGWGPAKAIHGTIVDGEYVLLLRRYGLFGAFWGAAIVAAVPIRNLVQKLRRVVIEKDSQVLVHTAIFSSLGALVLMVTNNVLSGYQVITPLIVLQGLAWRLMTEKKQE